MTDPITITLTRYREPDWLLDETLESLVVQIGVTGQVLFLDQNWTEAYSAAVSARSNDNLSFECVPCEARGLSYARNRAIAESRHDKILFIDSDAIAAADWAKQLSAALEGDHVGIAGSKVLPKWRERPPIFAKSNVVNDQYSLLDWGDDIIDVHRVVGAGFGVKKSAMPERQCFDESFGRRDGRLISGEESDLCSRVLEADGRVVYCGASIIYHQILPERAKLSWVWRRLYHAGYGRKRQGGVPAPSRPLGVWDWALMPITLPPYALGYAAALLSGQRS